ncbi:hypothetical protein [Enterococcus timonensis]|uniref:hypothetical protein n=1 Tax=Enterococcus timonensis TaxID=1852364 RepID=UPI0008DAFC6C|nr:hypothetical protein [Enterococcus timonensis]
MIEINSALSQDKIIEVLNSFEKDGVTFAFKEKKGLKLLFNVSGTEDFEDAARLAKSRIKEEDWGSVLYFSAHGVN